MDNKAKTSGSVYGSDSPGSTIAATAPGETSGSVYGSDSPGSTIAATAPGETSGSVYGSDSPGSTIAATAPGEFCIYLNNRFMEICNNYEMEFNVSIKEINQLIYNDVLLYIYDSVVKPLNIDYNNPFILDNILDCYIKLSFRMNKSISLYGYSIITGIPYTTLHNWKYNNTKGYIYYDKTVNKLIDSNSIGLYKYHHKENVIIEIPNNMFKQLCEKIQLTREHMLTDKVEQGSIPSLALGKIEFGWIESQKEKMQVEVMQKYTLPQDILKEYSENK